MEVWRMPDTERNADYEALPVWDDLVMTLCVVCPRCGYAFGSEHTDTKDGGYTCDACGARGRPPPEDDPLYLPGGAEGDCRGLAN